MLHIDGSMGEGGGQVLRSSLALAIVTGTPVHLSRIRARREKPGLRRQHLTAVHAAAAVGDADVEGDRVGSTELVFRPRGVRAGEHRLSVGTAGSATLVLQTVLPALLRASRPSRIEVEGGTHNPRSPSFDFLERTFVPLVRRMGPAVSATLLRPGFYPKGGGRIVCEVQPVATLAPLELAAPGAIRRVSATARVAGLPRHIAEREIRVVSERLHLGDDDVSVEELDPTWGPGNVVVVHAETDALVETFTGFGQKGIRAERVARSVADEASRWIAASVAVDEHLADQLLLLLALAGGGSFTTTELSSHARTQIEVIGRFLDVTIEVAPAAGGCAVRVATG